VLYLEPGTYDVGSTMLFLHGHVALVGAGRDVTTIKGEDTSGVIVNQEPGAVVTDVTVRATGTPAGGSAIAFQLVDAGGATTTLRRVTAITDAGGTGGASLALWVSGGTAVAEDVDLRATNSTYDNFGLNAESGATVTVMRSSVLGTGGGSLGSGSVRLAGANAHIASSQLTGGTTILSSTIACVYDYNDSFAPLSATCT
jgi:hypothetical protein